jgi:hypothetical protein
MVQRPRSVTIISWLFIVLGAIALIGGLLPIGEVTLVQRAGELKSHWYVHLSRLLEIVAGVFMLYGMNWARWLMVVWMVFHVVVGALHSVVQLFTHVAIFTVIGYFLFRPQATGYFLQKGNNN